jgi:hypothetical protein
MRLLKVLLGAIAALFTVAYVVQFVGVVLNADGGVRSTTEIAASLVPAVLAAAITLLFFKSAFKRTSDSKRSP